VCVATTGEVLLSQASPDEPTHPPTTRTDHALQVFTPYGKLRKICFRRSLGLRGQAFVIFETTAAAQAALDKAKGYMVYGHPLSIAFAHTPSDITLRKQGKEPPKRAAHAKKGLAQVKLEKVTKPAPAAVPVAQPFAPTPGGVPTYPYGVPVVRWFARLVLLWGIGAGRQSHVLGPQNPFALIEAYDPVGQLVAPFFAHSPLVPPFPLPPSPFPTPPPPTTTTTTTCAQAGAVPPPPPASHANGGAATAPAPPPLM
jgi:hypothetical protein